MKNEKTIVDLHVHSHYSRATSKQLTIPGLAQAAAIKGVDVIATGDITHPKWVVDIEKQCEEDGSGFLRMRDSSSTVLFTLFGEVASIYKKHDKGRRIHTLFGFPTIASVKKFNKTLIDKGFNLAYDGRPIVGMDVQELAKIALDSDDRALVIPAHIWTPWFSLFGSKSGFDSFEECFGEMAKHIYGIETGLSSDPLMNWHISDLNHKTILSNSDAHSPDKIGREANVFLWKKRTYEMLYHSIQKNVNLDYTIEFFPEEGKYHLDGHRACGIRFTPEETKKHNGICPVCGLPLVVGVLNRVDQLTDQTAKTSKNKKVPYKSIVPLREIIADAFGVGVSSKKVAAEFNRLIEGVGSEFHILLDASISEIRSVAQPIVAEAIERVRKGQLHIQPGFDGEFGTIHVFTEEERATFLPKQKALF